MCELGNAVINSIYEARVEEMTVKKPHSSSCRYDSGPAATLGRPTRSRGARVKQASLPPAAPPEKRFLFFF